MNKDQLSKLASLDNEKTKKFLEDFALAEKGKIISATTNEDIIAHLDLLSAIYYRVPDVIVWVVNYLVYKAKVLPAVDKVTPIGKFSGTDHEEVLIKCLELAKSVRYYDVEKTIKLAYGHINHANKTIAGSASKIIEELVDYNHQMLPKIGIVPQLRALQFVEKKLKSKTPSEHDLSFVKIVIQHVLETSASFSRMTSADTITFTSGDISGHKNIAKVRRQAINFTLSLFKKLTLAGDKSSIFPLFEQACRMPMNSPVDSDLGKIIQSDRQYIVKQLASLIFSGNKIVQSLSIAMQTEHLMHWFFVHMTVQEKLGTNFIKRLYKDARYKLFSQFVHDDTYRHSKYEDIEKDARKAVDAYIAKISNQNKSGILKELNDLAREAKKADEWKFLTFKQLLEKLGQEKPDIAFGFVKNSIQKKNELSSTYFLPFLLAGLRRANRFDLWDQSSEIILKLKNKDMAFALVGSIYMSHTLGTDLVVRPKEDINFLSNLIERKNRFSFIKEPTNLLSFFTINALRIAYLSNPNEVEKLTLLEMQNNPAYFAVYLHNISIYSRHNEGFNLADWSQESKDFLIERVIKIPDLDWQIQAILPLICSSKEIVNLFIKRIKYKNEMLGESENYFDSPYRHYDPVPYHMNDELLSFIKTDPETIGLIAKNLSFGNGMDSFELSQLIKNLRLDPRIIMGEISKGTEKIETKLKKIISSLSSIDANDPDFLVELAGQTSSKSIHDSLYGRLSATGVVSGEFGIANAYKHKREAIEKYKDSANENIRSFVATTIERLKATEDRARKEAEQEKEIRRIDFESNN